MLQPLDDAHFMKVALQEAERAFEAGEVPVGAVVTCKGQIIARGHNLTERLRDFTAHAEMQAFTSASEFLGGKYLTKCTLYVTLEPCVMCGGAAYNTRIGKIVFGAYDKRRGFSQFSGSSPILQPKTEVVGGVMEKECTELLLKFFSERRK
jgi:tRNA(adenine34) deaminase